MQTWLPYPNFRVSAHVLDALSLGRQLADCLTMIAIRSGEVPGGQRRWHVCTQLWWHYPGAMCLYADAIVSELHTRGYHHEIPSPRSAEGQEYWKIEKSWSRGEPELPPWIGLERIHASHRAELLRRDPDWYSQMAWDESPACRLEWPLPVPRPGEDVLHAESGRVGMVVALDDRRDPVVLADGVRTTVPRSLFHDGVWRRCTVRRG